MRVEDEMDQFAHDVCQVALGAAAWADGIPIARNDNLPEFQRTVNRVLGEFGLSYDFDKGQP